MSQDADPESLLVVLPRDVARFLERTVWDVGEHLAGGREVVPGPADLERELAALMWDLRDAFGQSQPHDLSRSPESFVVH
jgi:hypothetical protein